MTYIARPPRRFNARGLRRTHFPPEAGRKQAGQAPPKQKPRPCGRGFDLVSDVRRSYGQSDTTARRFRGSRTPSPV